MKKNRKKEPVKDTFTRAEILTAVAGVYRREQEEYHRLAERAREALDNGEAALYSLCDDEAQRQQFVIRVVQRVAGALGLSDEELNAAANAGKEVE